MAHFDDLQGCLNWLIFNVSDIQRYICGEWPWQTNFGRATRRSREAKEDSGGTESSRGATKEREGGEWLATQVLVTE